jgi:hypothetical protein
LCNNLKSEDLVICRILPVDSDDDFSPTDRYAELRSAVTEKATGVDFADKRIPNPKAKNKFKLEAGCLRATLPTVAELIACVDPKVLTKSDKTAIQNPAHFIAKDCDYKWLPSHREKSKKNSVRDRYEVWEKNKKDEQGLSEPGGLRVLLEYRTWITERALECTKEQTHWYTLLRRQRQLAELTTNNSEAIRSKFLEIKPLQWGAAGSTTPTSDIDVSLNGDGTEYAVWAFNNVFRSWHENVESGIVFDVNVYGAGFIPEFPLLEWLKFDPTIRTTKVRRPKFEHEFQDYNKELADARNQLIHAFAKLRRYMPPKETGEDVKWTAFLDRFDGEKLGTLPLLDCMGKGREKHLKWQNKIARSIAPTITENHVKKDDKYGEKYLTTVKPAKLMEAQNRCYELVCRGEVETARAKFNLSRLQLLENSPSLDEEYGALRDALSESCYFANESYPTVGAILQTVCGKQLRSRNVGTDRYTTKQRSDNVAYTAHELMASIVDQLADIHKEGDRHFRDHPEDVAGTVLACSKYIHRLLNSTKWLYRLFKVAEVQDAQSNFPEALFEKVEDWEAFRKYGFGLIALKKMKLDRYEKPPKQEEVDGPWFAFTKHSKTGYSKQIKDASLLSLFKFRLGIEYKDVLAFIEKVNNFKKIYSKYPSKEQIVDSLLLSDKEQLHFTKGKNEKLITKDQFRKLKEVYSKSPGKEQIVDSLLLSDKEQLHFTKDKNEKLITKDQFKKLKEVYSGSLYFYPFFDKFVASILTDYVKFYNLKKETLEEKFGKNPPFVLTEGYEVPNEGDDYENADADAYFGEISVFFES